MPHGRPTAAAYARLSYLFVAMFRLARRTALEPSIVGRGRERIPVNGKRVRESWKTHPMRVTALGTYILTTVLATATGSMADAYQDTAPSAAPIAVETPSPRQLFVATFRRLKSFPVPAYAVWTTTWLIQFSRGEVVTRTTTSQHRYALRTADDIENASDPARNGRLPSALIRPQFLGPFSWTFEHAAPRLRPASAMIPDTQTGLRVIASVIATSIPEYAIELVGTERVYGNETYHLKLTPAHADPRYNLRDLWVDTHSYDLREAHFLGSYSPNADMPTSPSDVTCFFAEVGPYWLATRNIFTYSGHDFSGQVLILSDVQVDKMAFPDTLPDWLFESDLYKVHEDSQESDPLVTVLSMPTQEPENPLSPPPMRRVLPR